MQWNTLYCKYTVSYIIQQIAHMLCLPFAYSNKYLHFKSFSVLSKKEYLQCAYIFQDISNIYINNKL